ncbi:MAG: aldo/keto reductase [Myxococcota bacterium]
MRRAVLGSTGVQVPVVGQGTWQMEQDDRASAVAAIRAALDVGMNHVDTAELYGAGRVEEIVAEAIAGRRHEVFLVSKVLPDHATRRGTVQACEQSLQRLKTDHLDLYLLHWPGEHPLRGTIEAFEQLVKDGKIRAWGVSNFDVAELEEALTIAGPGRIACNQVLYHLKERAIEHAVIPWCQKHGVAVVGYSPFGSGDFPSERSAGGKVLQRIADAHGATPRQVALSFLVRDEGVFTIPKSSNAERVRENAGAGELRLSDDDVAEIDRAFPLRKPPRTLPVI